MFSRIDATYDIKPEVVRNILKSEANPLNRISKMIPDGAKVLDLGAGNGLLAAVLRVQHQDLVIDGIEPNPYAVDIAKCHYRNLYCGFAQDYLELIREEEYDYLVLADVIEHLSDPLQFLRDLIPNLPPQSKIILSVPNVAFGAVRLALMYGKFEYVDSGLLEKTHLRFFTRETLEMLIRSLGLNAEKMFFLRQNIFETEIKLEKLPFNWFLYNKVLGDELSSVYQFMVVLSQVESSPEIKYFGKKTRLPWFRYVYERLKKYKK